MIVYKTTASTVGTRATTRWSFSKKGAATDRGAMVKAGFKRNEVNTVAVEFKPGKIGLRKLLNDHAY